MHPADAKKRTADAGVRRKYYTLLKGVTMKCWMKQILIMIFVFLAGCAGLQPIADADRTFERIVEAPGYSKEQIFNGTKIWIAENFKSAKAVLEYENKDAGTIIAQLHAQ